MAENTVKISFHNHKDMKLKTTNNKAGDAIEKSILALSASRSDDINDVQFIHGDLFYYSTEDKEE